MTKLLTVLLMLVVSVFALAQDAEKIKSGDKIRLTCEEEATLNKDYTVTEQGIVLVDFLGAVKVEGLTEQEAASTISKKLVDERILRSATITVTIVESLRDPVVFRGAVGVTGQSVYKDGMRLSDVIRLAHADEKTDLTRIEIRSRDGKVTFVDFTKFDPATNENNPLLRPGDTVIFPEKTRPGLIIVLGGVKNPGGVEIEPDMTVRSVIEKAGGFSPVAIRSSVKVERTGAAPVTLDLTKANIDMVLKVGDRVIVPIRNQRSYVQVFGAINDPGFRDLIEGMTLSEAIAASGGTLAGSKRSRVRLTRTGAERLVTMHDLDAIEAGLAEDPVLQPNDKIYVDKPGSKSMEILKSIVMLALLYILIGK